MHTWRILLLTAALTTAGCLLPTTGDDDSAAGDDDDSIPTSTWLHVTTKETHSCGIRSDGILLCWGYNDDGQCDVPL